MHILSLQTELSAEPIEDGASTASRAVVTGSTHLPHASAVCFLISAAIMHSFLANTLCFIAISDGKETVFAQPIVQFNTAFMFVVLL